MRSRSLYLLYASKPVSLLGSCPRLSPPSNGMVELFSAERKATYTCNEGYSLIGYQIRLCCFGVWLGNPPQCAKGKKTSPNQIRLRTHFRQTANGVGGPSGRRARERAVTGRNCDVALATIRRPINGERIAKGTRANVASVSSEDVWVRKNEN